MKPGVRRAMTCRSTVVVDRLALGVHLEDLAAAGHVGAVDGDLAVEAARAQQRGVEDVGPVRRGDHDDAALDVEAVHLDEHLVERLLALVVPAAHAGAAVAADGVDLVDEDDRGGVLLGLVEQVAHAARADADEHLDEVRAGDRVERHARLAGDGARQQGLAGAGRAVQQDALGDLGADGLELRRVLEELLDLLQLLERLVGARDVGERRLRRVLADELGLGLAELHDPAAAALHLVHEEEQQAEDDEERQEAEQQRDEQALLVDLDVVADVGVVEGVGELAALVDEELGLQLRAVVERDADLLLLVEQERGLAVLVGAATVAGRDRLQHAGGVGRLVAAVAAQAAGEAPAATSRHEEDVEEGAAGVAS